MYTLKSIARRTTALGFAAALVMASVLPATAAFAQALTPLTERSLLLSSSAPGYVDTDGSGYSATNPNPAGDGDLGNPATDVPYHYAPAGSGPNGKKTGQTFTFRASSTSTINAFTLQYCTVAAGMCQAPGNNAGDAGDDSRLDNEGAGGGWENLTSDFDITGVFAKAEEEAAPVGGEFQISVNGNETDVDDWAFEASNWEDDTNKPLTGKNNLITLRSLTGTPIQAGDYVEIKFVASESVFITNPGAGHFFVKINTYNDGSATGQLPDTDANIVDGGVTVANVMTDSIHITTKVLETMAFSVGIENPDTILQEDNDNNPDPTKHNPCEVISQTSSITGLTNNRLNLGDPSAEFSLDTGKAFDVFSYWRLSSNSSGGAVVYYSGDTLVNTVGDKIDAMTQTANSMPGGEQFGLGFVDVSSGAHADTLSASFLAAVSDGDMPHQAPTSYPFITVDGQAASAPFDSLAAQPASVDYSQASGTIDDGNGGQGSARFKFLPSSLLVPEKIAEQDETVISCATAKMRYVANIGADTPAGVYTTKVNYLAAPQY